MAFRYLLEPNSPDSHQADPWWLAVVVRFKHTKTFDRAHIVSQASEKEMNVSLLEADIGPVDEHEPLILTNQIVSFQVQFAKASHTCSASFRVVPGQFHFESQTHAGDWLMFWAFDNYDDYRRVLSKVIDTLQNGSAQGANQFMDGLKFVGRLNAPKRRRGVDPATGMPRKEYTLTAVGFSEFDAKVYYNQAHQAKYQELIGGFVAQVSDVASNVSKVDDVIKGGLPLTTAEHAQIWLETFLGAGPGAASKGFEPANVSGAAFEAEVQNSLLQTPNDVFLVPTSVGRLLGIQSTAGTLRYFDLLNIFIGVQGPSGSIEGTRALGDDFSDVIYQGLVPYSIGEPSGTFRTQYMNFGMVTVWDLVSGFSNAPLNEMFVSLRVNSSGRVGPTFMLRQNPMSSVPAVESLSQRGWAMTSFVDVPRWVVSERLVQDEDVGPSDSLHFNYIHVQGSDVPGELPQAFSQTAQLVLSPPMADMADIKRSGLRPFVASLNADITGLVDSRSQLGRAYTQFMADILMDAHLKWSGTLSLFGIQEPIAIGDNCEFDGIVYHIEAISHVGHIETNSGRKHFVTSLQLSNGISAESQVDNVMPYEVPSKLREASDYESRVSAKDGAVNIDRLLDEQNIEQRAAKLFR